MIQRLVYRLAFSLSSLRLQWDRGMRDGREPPNPIKPEYRKYVGHQSLRDSMAAAQFNGKSDE